MLHKQDESLAWVLVDVELKSPFKQCLILAFFSAMLSCIIIELTCTSNNSWKVAGDSSVSLPGSS